MKATHDEFQRVRESECEMSTHDIEVVYVMGSTVPINITCKRCGQSWSVGAALVENQMIGWLKGRATAIEEEAAEASEETLPGMRLRVGALREAAFRLEEEVGGE